MNTVMAKVTPEVPEVLKEPSQIEIMFADKDTFEVPRFLRTTSD